MSDLPANVCAVTDRHGKVRYRFRRKGWASAYLKGEPGTAEFHASMAAILAGGPVAPGPVQSPRRYAPRSLDHLFIEVKKSRRWAEKADRTRHVQSLIVERFLDRISASGKRYGERPVADVTPAWLDRVFAKMAHTPAAANVLRKILSGMMHEAAFMRWRTDNPVQFTRGFKEGEGLHTVTEDEIARYRATHANGTMARLVLELALNTAGRRCNIATLTRDDIREGRIILQHAKGCNEVSVPMLPTTKAALDALPAAPIRYLVVTQFGKPFSVAGLGNRARKWFDDAGLPHCSLHGLRKAISRRIAESGGTDAEGQAITGHRKAETFIHYRARANRSALADRALSTVLSTFDVQPLGNTGETDA